MSFLPKDVRSSLFSRKNSFFGSVFPLRNCYLDTVELQSFGDENDVS
jgi:hypothetical protein